MSKKNKKKRNKEYKKTAALYKGRFEITRSGMGFVVVEGLERDVIIRPNDFNKAFHGDLVRVEVTKGDARSGRMQGVITQIIERKQKQFVGVIEVNRDFAFFIPDSSKAIPDFFIPASSLNGAKDGQKVIAQIVSWEKNDKRPRAEVIEIVTEAREADLAMKEILIQQGFPLLFTEEVMEESSRLPDTISIDEIKRRRDM
ncbi:MAG: hypothetical protein RL640_1104, partial [Bacteroidota bacterium]